MQEEKEVTFGMASEGATVNSVGSLAASPNPRILNKGVAPSSRTLRPDNNTLENEFNFEVILVSDFITVKSREKEIISNKYNNINSNKKKMLERLKVFNESQRLKRVFSLNS